jgi:polygalacturonase
MLRITETGARPLTGIDNGEAIQRAIDLCAVDGGGRVVVPDGTFTTGPLLLKTGVELYLTRGSVLRFVDDPVSYSLATTRWEGVECHAYCSLLRVEDARDVAITGEGTIDGNGERWWQTYRGIRSGSLEASRVPGVSSILEANRQIPYSSGGGGRETGFLRPALIQVKNSSDVLLEGIVARNSPCWNTHILYSDQITIRNVKFQNPPDAPNTDGLSIDSSRHVLVEGCRFDVGDDCLGLKAGAGEDGLRVGRGTHDVTVRDCSMNHGHGGIVIGSETAGGISDVVAERCTFKGTDRGIRIKSRRGRGGVIAGIRASDLQMEDVGCPLVINLFYRCGAREEEAELLGRLQPQPIDALTPSVSGVEIERLAARHVRYAAAVIFGLPERPIEGLRMVDCTFQVDQGYEPGEPAMDFGWNRFSGAGLVTRNVEGVSLERIEVSGTTPAHIDLGSAGPSETAGD